MRRDLDAIRSVLGVCPQHDVLWGDLTALEHMKLFGNLKDIPRKDMENEIATLLADVQLDRVRVVKQVGGCGLNKCGGCGLIKWVRFNQVGGYDLNKWNGCGLTKWVWFKVWFNQVGG